MRAGNRTGKGLTTGKFRGTDQLKRAGSAGGGPSSVILCSWCLLIAWLVFLIYCWNAGLLHSSKVQEELKYVTDVINRTENSLRGGISHIHLGVPTEHFPNKIPSSALHKKSVINSPPAWEDSDVHVIFSTDCTPYQDWQTLVVFHSAMTVGQKGRVTRIASGCDDAKKEELTALYKQLYPHYGVHFTPDFKKDEKTNKKYDFYNKPWGLKHWLDYSEPPVKDDVIIALIDPDMIFVRPITSKVKGVKDNLYFETRLHRDGNEREVTDFVSKGHPVAQTYGLGAPWTNDNHKKFNRGKICGEGSPCLKPNEQFGGKHYSVGPPYLVHKADMVSIAKTWTTFVPRVYEGYPYLLAEMYAYSMAAAHEELPHLQLNNMMVSNTDAGGEGWDWIDKLNNTCVPPVNGIYYPDLPMPTMVHFCQGYRAGPIGFAKRQVPKNIFSCEQNLLLQTPDDLGFVDYRIKDGKRESLSNRQVKRNSFMLCVIYNSINAAVIDFKKRMCGPTNSTSYDKTINVLKKG